MKLLTAVRYLGGWSLIISFVVLLTVIFSFLGTIFCAVLAGMMVRPARLPRWQPLVISFIFPAVLFSVLRVSKAELLGKQVQVLSLLCFGSFWLAYLLAWAVMVYERKEPAEAASPSATLPVPLAVADGIRSGNGASGAPDSLVVDSTGALDTRSLELLQGQWLPESAGASGRCGHRVLQIEHQRLFLRVANAQGQLTLLGQRPIKFCLCDSTCPFASSEPPGQSPGHPAPRADATA